MKTIKQLIKFIVLSFLCFNSIILSAQNDKVDEGIKLLENKNYYEAVIYFNELIKLDKSNDALYRRRGIAFENLKKYDEAFIDYNKSISLNPKSCKNYLSRASLKHTLNNHIDCLHDLHKIKELNCEDKGVLWSLNILMALTKLELQELDSALMY